MDFENIGDMMMTLDPLDGYGDINMTLRDAARDSGLETAVLISLFSDRRENDERLLPDDSGGKGGWWAGAVLDSDIEFGSRLWLLQRGKDVNEVLTLSRQYCLEALQWMLDGEVASEIDVTATKYSSQILFLSIRIVRPGVTQSNEFTYRYFLNWEAQTIRRG